VLDHGICPLRAPALEPGDLTRATLCVALVVLGAWPAGNAAATEPLSAAGVDVANFAYASQLGSGIYSLNGRTLQVYRVPLSWQLREPAAGRPGLRLRAPVTFGLIDFKPSDAIGTGLPDRLDTVSAALGVELEFPLDERWRVVPYLEAGRAFDLGGDTDAHVYAADVHAIREHEAGVRSHRFATGVTWAAVELDSNGGHGDFLRLDVAAEMTTDSPWTVGERHVRIGGYGRIEWYADRPDEPVVRAQDAAPAEPLQVEVGVTFGLQPMPTIWGLPLPRAGLGWRAGRHLSVFRLVIGAPF
jgi:hypothetical protein